jgi:ectoine hydroxylase-related dioxygenase (phytanoyl-CoA dioxygenase family)
MVHESAGECYERDGFCLSAPILPEDLVARVSGRMDAIVAGEYETGVPPHARHFSDDDPPDKIRKIDDAHLSDDTVYDVVSHPAIGRYVAETLGAQRVQVWATQLLIKPTTANPDSAPGNVGWHQDKQYWPYWDGEVFTTWIAISNVTGRSGCMRFVRSSHRWGFLNRGDFFAQDLEAQRATIVEQGKSWEEVPAVLAPGAVSLHHCLTYHGSGPNCETWPRKSFAVHMRTEKSKPIGQEYYTEHLDDPRHTPVIYEA